MPGFIKNSPNYKYWAAGALAIGVFGSVVDHGSVNIALPSIAADFGTGLATIQWVVIGFALTISALLLPMGRFADIVGRTKIYILGTLIFAAAAALAAAAPSLGILVLARIIQGCGAAMSQGTGMAIIVSTFPAVERGKALGMMLTMVGVGAVTGPALGGLLVGVFGWRSVFIFNVPLGLLGVMASVTILDKTQTGDPNPSATGQQFDWLGAALSMMTVLILLTAIANGQRWGWESPAIVIPLLSVGVILTGFIWWELRVDDPLLDLRLFNQKVFSLGVSSAFFTFVGSSAVLFLTPFYLQSVLGKSPTQAGLIVVPAALCIAAAGPISGRLSDRYGWRLFTVTGLTIAIAGLLLLSTMDESSSVGMVIAALVLQSIGVGTFYSPNASSILSVVKREKFGVVAAFTNLVRNGANVTSVAMATVVVTTTMAGLGFETGLGLDECGIDGDACHAFASGLTRAYRIMAGLLAVSLCISAISNGRTASVPAEADETVEVT